MQEQKQVAFNIKSKALQSETDYRSKRRKSTGGHTTTKRAISGAPNCNFVAHPQVCWVNLGVRHRIAIWCATNSPFCGSGISDALEDNFGWIAPQNLFDESSQPKRKEKGDSQPYISNIQFLYDKFSSTHLKHGDAFDPKKT